MFVNMIVKIKVRVSGKSFEEISVYELIAIIADQHSHQRLLLFSVGKVNLPLLTKPLR